MVKKKNLFAPHHIGSSIFMLLALLWLTISIPFVYAGQQAQKQMAEKQQTKNTGYDTNSLPAANEERSESGVTTLSEYLHEMHVMEQHFCFIKSFYKAHPDQYFPSFSPELLSPPPEA